MRPEKRNPIVKIPITFDSTSKPQGLTNDKFYLSLLVLGVWLFFAIVLLFADFTIGQKFLYILGSFIVITLIVRFLLLREAYFKKKREELIEKNFQFPHSVFWNIYEITDSYPYICRYANGLKSMFVVFDKDVIIGQDADADYYHYEAIADAYQQMSKRGIDCVHIDYMDTVGKDDRIKGLFNIANDSENEDLQNILTHIFHNVEYIMQHSYASYDVYCFYYAGKDELFMDELEVVLDAFLEANYIRYRILNKYEIGELVKSVFNINEFSARETSERLFTDLGGTHYLTPIWVERETSKGVERVVLNKTRAQIEKERETKEAVNDMKRGRNKKVNKKNLDFVIEDLEDEDIDDSYVENSDISPTEDDMYLSQQINPYSDSEMYMPEEMNKSGYGLNDGNDISESELIEKKGNYSFDDDEILE